MYICFIYIYIKCTITKKMPKANVAKPTRGVPAALPRAAAGGGTADHAGDGRGMPRMP